MKNITNIYDLRLLAKKKVPKAIFDYVDRGSYDEITIKSNKADLDEIKLRQRVLIDVDKRNLQTEILGQKSSMPIAIAPTGLTGIMHANGEILGAQVAEEVGIPFCLSTMSICSIEQVAEHTTKPFWFQLYIMRDREFVKNMILRAKDAGCKVLVLTADLQIQGQRHQDIKNGLTVPPKITPRNIWELMIKPSWGIKMLGAKSKSFGNLTEYMNSSNIKTLSTWIASQFDASITWDDINFVRKYWDGKIIIKGILDIDDAKKCVEYGVDGLIVSNHGGRQLDGAPSAISALPQIKDAVGNELEVYFDSGITSGADVLKAKALGADACFIGKAFLYGLGASGKVGVAKTLEILQKELDVSMALTGSSDINKVNLENVIL
jgi:L-lactate dehydrogenase (cytochrome)